MLPAPEHAAFVLREVLQYSRMNAARILKTSAANVDHAFGKCAEAHRKHRSSAAGKHSELTGSSWLKAPQNGTISNHSRTKRLLLMFRKGSLWIY